MHSRHCRARALAARSLILGAVALLGAVSAVSAEEAPVVGAFTLAKVHRTQVFYEALVADADPGYLAALQRRVAHTKPGVRTALEELWQEDLDLEEDPEAKARTARVLAALRETRPRFLSFFEVRADLERPALEQAAREAGATVVAHGRARKFLVAKRTRVLVAGDEPALKAFVGALGHPAKEVARSRGVRFSGVTRGAETYRAAPFQSPPLNEHDAAQTLRAIAGGYGAVREMLARTTWSDRSRSGYNLDPLTAYWTLELPGTDRKPFLEGFVQ